MFDTVELEELVGKLVGADMALASPAELMDLTLALERTRSRIDVVESRALARLDAEETTVAEYGLRTPGWLAHQADQPGAGCRRRVKVARALAGPLGEIAEAVADGRLTYAHAEVVALSSTPRNGEEMNGAQGALIDLADRLRFDPWARAVRDIAATLDADGGYDPNADPDANRLSFTALGDRTVEIKGRLVGELAVRVPQAIEQLADELLRQASVDRGVDPSIQIPARTTLRALALGEICRRGRAVELGSTRRPRSEALYVIEADGDGDRRADVDGRMLPTSGLDALRCDEQVRAALLDSLGNPVVLGHRRDLVSPDQRRALTLRDGGCIFPGCDRPPAWCDAHHVVHRRDGGPTTLANLGLLCRWHHGIVHRVGWKMAADPELPERFLITTATGRVLASQRNPRAG